MKVIDIHKVVESVVKEVVHSMKNEKLSGENKIAFVFNDIASYELMGLHLQALLERRIGHDIYIIEGSTIYALTDGLKGGIAYSSIELVARYDYLVIDEIDLDSAGKIVLGIKGSACSELVYNALIAEKEILTHNGLAGITKSEQKRLGTTQLPKPYQVIFKRNVRELKNLGVQFIDQSRITTILTDKIQPKHEITKLETDDGPPVISTGLTYTKKLITYDWIKGLSDIADNQINLKKKTIISPLALDLIKEKKININYFD